MARSGNWARRSAWEWDWWDYWTERRLTRQHEIMKQGSAEQLAENERRCKWSTTLAALARVPVGAIVEFPNIALSETNRLRSVLHTRVVGQVAFDGASPRKQASSA